MTYLKLKKNCVTSFLNKHEMIHINAGILTLNLHNSIYYIHYIAIIMDIKVIDWSIDVYYRNSEMT